MIYLIEPNKSKDGHFHNWLNTLLKADNTVSLECEYVFKRFKSFSPIRTVFDFYKAISRLLNAVPKGNIAHILYADMYYKIPFVNNKLLSRNKLIVTMHSCPNGYIKHLLLKNFCKRVNVVIVNSDYIRNKYLSLGIKNVVTISHPSFQDYSDILPKGELKKKYGIPDDKIVLSALGGIRADKGLDILLESFNYLSKSIKNKIVLNIAGGVIDSLTEDDIRNLCEIYEINARLNIRFLTENEFKENVAVSDYMVFPYRKHMTANSGPMGEAIVCRVPCIVPYGTNLAAVADYYGAAFTFEQENPKSLAKVITDIVISNPVVNFHNIEELNVETFIEKHSRLYKKVDEGIY